MRRAAEALFMLGALGEIGVGAALIPFPTIAALLLDMQLDPNALFVARGLGVAALAVGFTWWMARRDPKRVAYCAAGFILYNVGIGLLFALAAAGAARPVVPWLVAVVHVLTAAGFSAALLMPRENRAV